MCFLYEDEVGREVAGSLITLKLALRMALDCQMLWLIQLWCSSPDIEQYISFSALMNLRSCHGTALWLALEKEGYDHIVEANI